jgi:phosphoglycerate dehydrogenase-like enzyme
MNNPIRLLTPDVGSGLFIKRLKENPAAVPFRILVPQTEAEDSLLSLAPEADAILCYKARLPGSVIRAGTSLRFIQKHGLNCKNIDVAAATARNIPVATLPLMRNASVAEHALALMLACARKVIPGHVAVVEASYQQMGLHPTKTSQWDFRGNWAGIEGVTELSQTTAGIIGMGDIGMEIAKRCRAFGMIVYYYQRTPHPKEVENALEVSYLSLNELLKISDYVVLIIPHTPQTERLIGAKELALMKSSATLINVARGALVDEAALAAALENKRIAMAGLDVYGMEPLPASSPLRKLPNVVLLPHTGGGSNRSWDVDIPAALQNIQRFFKGEKPFGVINMPEGEKPLD